MHYSLLCMTLGVVLNNRFNVGEPTTMVVITRHKMTAGSEDVQAMGGRGTKVVNEQQNVGLKATCKSRKTKGGQRKTLKRRQSKRGNALKKVNSKKKNGVPAKPTKARRESGGSKAKLKKKCSTHKVAAKSKAKTKNVSVRLMVDFE